MGRGEATRPAEPFGSQARLSALEAKVAEAVAELNATHRPMWASEKAQEDGKKPIGCATCYPADGSWPCITAEVADDLQGYDRPESGVEAEKTED